MLFALEFIAGDEQDRAVIDAIRLVLTDYVAIRSALHNAKLHGTLCCDLFPDKRKVVGRAAVTRLIDAGPAFPVPKQDI